MSATRVWWAVPLSPSLEKALNYEAILPFIILLNNFLWLWFDIIMEWEWSGQQSRLSYAWTMLKKWLVICFICLWVRFWRCSLVSSWSVIVKWTSVSVQSFACCPFVHMDFLPKPYLFFWSMIWLWHSWIKVRFSLLLWSPMYFWVHKVDLTFFQ